MFDLGLMGIEIPEEMGGPGGNFFMSVLAIEALAEVDPAAAVIVDVQNTIANNVIMRWGNDAGGAHAVNRGQAGLVPFDVALCPPLTS